MSFSKWKALFLVLPLLMLSHLALAEKSAAIPLCGDMVEICLVPSEQVNAENCEPGNWLFLPAFAQREEAVLLIDEARQSMPALSPVMGEEGVFSGSTDSGETLYVMQSQNLRTLFLFSDDPENQGRQWVENCERHENEAQASMALVAADGTVDYAGHIKKLRGRGNGTWRWAKKPYQLKLDDKADLLNLGDPDERNRTWVLLALATDATMLHDRVALDLGLEMGLNETSHSEHVDLYYDGEYRGTYLLCEKVEVGKGRVNEMNSTKLVEQLNEAVGQENLEDLHTEEGVNNFGQTYAWVEGVQGPENPADLAYLVELESPYTLSNQGWFHVEDGGLFGCKNPKYPNREMVAYISEKLASAHLALQNGTDIEKTLMWMVLHEWP